jgi:HPt (histidine-containing phosphotransfer) domain-containing protein
MNPLNKQTVDMILELADGDNSVLLEIFSSFLKDAKELSEEINSAVSNLDWETLQFKVHTLKGLSGTIGAKPLFEICKNLNNDLKNGNKMTAIGLANSLVIEYKELADYIRTNYQI